MDYIKIPTTDFEKYCFMKAYAKFLETELKKERERTKDLLFKNNRLTTQNKLIKLCKLR